MTNNKQKTNPENPNNQFSNSEPMTFTQKVEYVKSIDMTNNKQQTEINAVEYLDKVNQFAKENNTGKPKQQTAVEWLIEHIRQDVFVHSKSTKEWNQVFQQAKEMEKQRIIDAHYEGQCDETEGYPLEISKQYYNETYGGGEQ